MVFATAWGGEPSTSVSSLNTRPDLGRFARSTPWSTPVANVRLPFPFKHGVLVGAVERTHVGRLWTKRQQDVCVLAHKIRYKLVCR